MNREMLLPDDDFVRNKQESSLIRSEIACVNFNVAQITVDNVLMMMMTMMLSIMAYDDNAFVHLVGAFYCDA